jgi:hypothetical protein
MKFPQRSETHKVEAASWRLLQELAPENWIVREVTERDYGIDAYIEITTENGDVTGNLISIQLKGVKEIKWKASAAGIKYARSPSIKTSTAAYWLNLPVPVFLLVADLENRRIFFSSVEWEIRAQFDKLGSQESISFRLCSDICFGTKLGSVFFKWFVERERAHHQFIFHISNLLSHVESFSEFIAENQSRDSFMEVETEQHMQFRAIYSSCRMASLYLENKWDIESLNELYEMDRREWNDKYVYLHERTLDYVLKKIEVAFPRLVRRAIEVVCKEQSSYWISRDYVFYLLCGDLEWTVKRMEKRLASRTSML